MKARQTIPQKPVVEKLTSLAAFAMRFLLNALGFGATRSRYRAAATVYPIRIERPSQTDRTVAFISPDGILTRPAG
jgi:hypothetical protein